MNNQILKTTVIDLNNSNANFANEFDVLLNTTLEIKKGSVLSITDSYINLFDGANYQPGSIVIEETYEFTMKACFIYVNLVDVIPNGTNVRIPMGYNSVIVENGDIKTYDINIKILAGIYSPQDIVQIFNKQSCVQAYINSFTLNANMTLPAINGEAPANILPFSTVEPLTSVAGANTIELSFIDFANIWDQNYGWQLNAILDDDIYGVEPKTVLLHGSLTGLQIDFDEVQNRFFISRNFTPIISGDTDGFSVLRFAESNISPSDLNRTFIDRAGEVLILDFGYPMSQWDGSFWQRLGFSTVDLYGSEENPSQAFLWGRTYANINPLTNLMVNDGYTSNGFKPLKMQQGCEDINNTIAIIEYDGTTLGIYASAAPVYIPIPFLRVRVNLTTSGGFLSNGLNFGMTQCVSLMNLSPSSETTFGILNPNSFGTDGDLNISAIHVKFEDPRDSKGLKWISKKIFSSISLRIQQII